MRGAFKRNRDYKGGVRESMADGCTERMDFWFFTWLVYKQYSKKRKNKFKSIKENYPDKAVIIKSRKELHRYLENLS